jgi:DNA repair photolyase
MEPTAPPPSEPRRKPRPPTRGRGADRNPPNRFERLELPGEPDWLEDQAAARGGALREPTVYLVDSSRSVLSENDSPDLGFRWSVNPYRGCEHGCIYCYARPSHEYLGFSAGIDFESRILVKPDAPALLEKALRAPRWRPEPVLLCGNTDCYQPAERSLALTRGCLEVFLRLGHPVELISKNALVLRDLELLAALAAKRLVRVTISVTTLDPALAAAMEPRASAPRRRLEAIAALARAGVPVGVNAAPVIPGLTDHELPGILAAAAERGAAWAGYIMLRLPHAVKELFPAWLERHYPARAAKVLAALREVRGGRLTDPRFGTRQTGEGVRAEVIARLFQLTCARLGLQRRRTPLSTAHFDRAAPGGPRDAPRGTSPGGQERGAAPRQQELFPPPSGQG